MRATAKMKAAGASVRVRKRGAHEKKNKVAPAGGDCRAGGGRGAEDRSPQTPRRKYRAGGKGCQKKKALRPGEISPIGAKLTFTAPARN